MLQETMLQWMSASPTARPIDRELGDLDRDVLGPEPLLCYLRYDVDLSRESIRELDAAVVHSDRIDSLAEMDAPENMELLHHLGTLAGKRDVDPLHFESVFDLLP
jgi:hypothetical protein